jgi:hypothetical protein
MQDATSNIIQITDHAYDRAKERLSLSKDSFCRLATKAYVEGIKAKESKGRLKRYLDKLWFQYKTANNVVIYGENIFFFRENVLITVYQLPHVLRKFIKINKK